MATTTRRWRSPRPRRRDEKSPVAGRGGFLLLRALVLLLMAVLVGQLVRLQVVEGERFQQMAAINALRELQLPVSRGLIYDRGGRPLVYNRISYDAAVIPADVRPEQEGRLFQELGQLLGVPPEELAAAFREARGRQSPYDPLVVKEGLSREQALALKEREPLLPGVRLLLRTVRDYVSGPALAHVVGYTAPIAAEELAALQGLGYHLHDWLGKTGVEATYEAILRGNPGRLLVEVDAAGRPRRTIAQRPGQDGSSLLLTIDLDLQRRLYEALSAQVAPGQVAAAALMDVRTGEVLALVSLPSFDPNLFARPEGRAQAAALLSAPGKPLLNHALGELYPPLDTFKPLVAAAALQEGVIRPDTVLRNLSRYLMVSNPLDPRAVSDIIFDPQVLGELDLGRALAQGANIFFAQIAGGSPEGGLRGLGEERLARYARAFGLGRATGIDLSGEAAGLVPDARWKEEALGDPWRPSDTYRFGLGQSYLAVTPIQVLVATAALANGGSVLRPHLVREVRTPEGRVLAETREEVRSRLGIAPEHLAAVRSALVRAVDEGVARAAAVRGLRVAAITAAGEGGHVWLAGFAPADQPLVALVVYMAQGSVERAGTVAAQLLDYMFNQSGIAQALREGRR